MRENRWAVVLFCAVLGLCISGASALGGETPGAKTRTGAFKVVDTTGQLVGYYEVDTVPFFWEYVSIHLVGRYFMLPVGPSGFLNHDTDYSGFHFCPSGALIRS